MAPHEDKKQENDQIAVNVLEHEKAAPEYPIDEKAAYNVEAGGVVRPPISPLPFYFAKADLVVCLLIIRRPMLSSLTSSFSPRISTPSTTARCSSPLRRSRRSSSAFQPSVVVQVGTPVLNMSHFFKPLILKGTPGLSTTMTRTSLPLVRLPATPIRSGLFGRFLMPHTPSLSPQSSPRQDGIFPLGR